MKTGIPIQEVQPHNWIKRKPEPASHYSIYRQVNHMTNLKHRLRGDLTEVFKWHWGYSKEDESIFLGSVTRIEREITSSR